MTINIALATNDSIVLGCDSLSSMISTAIFPFDGSVSFALDAEGLPILDADGHPVVSMNPKNYRDVAVHVFGGVSKMFCLYEDEDTCVGAVTAGLAILGGVTIAEQARRFKRKTKENKTQFDAVHDVARAFADFIGDIWKKEYLQSSPEEQRHFLPTVQFIIAGFGRNDYYGKIFKADIAQEKLQEQFPDQPYSGICWGGQADYVERLMRGVDATLKTAVSRELARAMKAQRQATIDDISRGLEAAKVALPDDLHIEITEHQAPTLPWDSSKADVDFGNLSTQYAIDLVELLVNTQSGMQRFARGIPTVGGRTHIGVLKRGEEFVLLNEPKLQHKHTGYADEY